MSKGALLRRAAAQSISSGADTAISWDTEDLDEDSYWAIGTPTRIVFASSAWYILTAHLQWAAQNNGARFIDFIINGTTFRSIELSQTSQFNDPPQATAMAYYLANTDYVEVGCFQNSGSSVNLTAGVQVVRVPNGFGAMVRRTTNQSISTGTATGIIWDTEDRDDDSYWAAGSPTRFTIPVTGWYFLSAYERWASQANGTRVLDFRVNGGSARMSQFAPTNQFNDPAIATSMVAYLTAGDYVETVALQSSGSSVNITSAHAQIVRLQ